MKKSVDEKTENEFEIRYTSDCISQAVQEELKKAKSPREAATIIANMAGGIAEGITEAMCPKALIKANVLYTLYKNMAGRYNIVAIKDLLPNSKICPDKTKGEVFMVKKD